MPRPELARPVLEPASDRAPGPAEERLPAPAAERTLAPVADQVRELPHPARTRILLELAADVEGLASDLRDAGVPSEEAVRRAAERVVPSGAALEALVRLHRPLYRRLVAPLPDSALRRCERAVLLATTLFVLGAGVTPLWRQGLLADPSPFLWTVLALAGGVAAVCLAKSFRLFVRRDHDPSALDRGLGTLLGLSAAALLVAAAGTVVGLRELAVTLEAGRPDAVSLVTSWLLRESVLVATALLTATCGGLGWFVLAQRTAVVRGGDEEVRRILAGASPEGGTPARPDPSTPQTEEFVR